MLGSFVTVLAASLIVITAAFAFAHTRDAGHFTDAAGVAHGLARYVGSGPGALFAIILLNASIIGAAAVTLSTSYAFGDMFGHAPLPAPQRRATPSSSTASFTGHGGPGGRHRPHPRRPARA